jgi:hypothetical protein
VLRITARCWGLCDLATGFGAWTVMLGRAVGAELGSVRDIAAPLRPNVSSANDEMATASLEKKRDESPIAISSNRVDSHQLRIYS